MALASAHPKTSSHIRQPRPAMKQPKSEHKQTCRNKCYECGNDPESYFWLINTLVSFGQKQDAPIAEWASDEQTKDVAMNGGRLIKPT
jgi:hypothetical protein